MNNFNSHVALAHWS